MDHRGRRSRLAQLLPDSLVLLLGHTATVRDHPADHHPFRQDATFLYFTGLDEPDAALLVDTASGESTLFGVEPDLEDIVWHGPRPPLAERAATAGADSYRSASDLPSALAGRTPLTLPAPRPSQRDQLQDLLGDVAPSHDLIRAVAQLREVKDEEEIAEIDQALERARRLHAAAMAAISPGCEVAAVARHLGEVVAGTGGEWAYPVIFTTHGEVLHQFGQTGRMEAGDLLLHDGGVTSDGGYASDVTRTMPVTGTFDGRAEALYDIVFDAQALALAMMRPGVAWRDVHHAVGRKILEGFADLGLCGGDLDAAAEDGAYGLVFPHGVGHLLGIEVHDMEGLGEDLVGYDAEFVRSDVFGPSNLRFGKPLREGMVITVEPGAYLIGPLIERFRADGDFDGFWDWERLEDWVGVGGVRIEDVVRVTVDGAEVLGPPIPRTKPEVEEAMA